MRINTMLTIVLGIATACGLAAQDVSLRTMPRSQEEGNPTTSYVITPTVIGGFGASIYLRASCASLPDAVFNLAPKTLNAPYQTTSTLTVMVKGLKTGGDHRIVVEGYNGPLLVRDTVILTIASRPAWRVFNTSNSEIPFDTIKHIVVDTNGVGWMSTPKGLTRFDGTTWQTFTKENSALPSNTIYSLTMDHSNGVWVGTQGGLVQIRDGVWTKHPAPFATYSVAVSRNGTVWVVNQEGLSQYNGQWRQLYTQENSPLSMYGGDLATNGDGNVWIIGSNEMDRFDGTYWTHYDRTNLELDVTDYITTDRQDNIWLSGRGGVLHLQSGQQTAYPKTGPTSFPGPRPQSITFDVSGTTWIATGEFNTFDAQQHHINHEGGLGRYNGVDWWFYTTGNSGLPSNTIHAIRSDINNTLWIGTDKGLALLDGNAVPIVTFTTGVNNEPDHAPAQRGMIASVAPNPASGSVSVNLLLDVASNVQLTLHNALGQPVRTIWNGGIDEGARTLPFNVAELPAGVYIMRIVCGDAAESSIFTVHR